MTLSNRSPNPATSGTAYAKLVGENGINIFITLNMLRLEIVHSGTHAISGLWSRIDGYEKLYRTLCYPCEETILPSTVADFITGLHFNAMKVKPRFSTLLPWLGCMPHPFCQCSGPLPGYLYKP
jgi:hypothetical protein